MVTAVLNFPSASIGESTGWYKAGGKGSMYRVLCFWSSRHRVPVVRRHRNRPCGTQPGFMRLRARWTGFRNGGRVRVTRSSRGVAPRTGERTRTTTATGTRRRSPQDSLSRQGVCRGVLTLESDRARRDRNDGSSHYEKGHLHIGFPSGGGIAMTPSGDIVGWER